MRLGPLKLKLADSTDVQQTICGGGGTRLVDSLALNDLSEKETDVTVLHVRAFTLDSLESLLY